MEFTASFSHDRKVKPALLAFRTLSEAEIRALGSGQYVMCRLNNGRVGQARLTSAPKTWKRDASRVEVNVKHGLYDYACFSLGEALERFCVSL